MMKRIAAIMVLAKTIDVFARVDGILYLTAQVGVAAIRINKVVSMFTKCSRPKKDAPFCLCMIQFMILTGSF